MYAVIRTGGKQYRVTEGDVIEVERLKVSKDDPTLTLTPLLVVTDDGEAVHGASNLSAYPVTVKVVGDSKGDKVTVFKYRSKSGYKAKTGHRQRYSLIEVTSIGGGSAKPAAKGRGTRARSAPKAKAAPAPENAPAAEAPPADDSGGGDGS